jgi:ADP-ribose pyrophosphatase
MKPKILSKKVAYKGLWFNIERKKIKLPTGKVVEWENTVSPDFVAIVALDNKNNIYLSKEWRSAWEREILQIPAGECKYKKKREILKQARNELREEIGFDAKKWQKLVTVPFSARDKKRAHIFLAKDLFKSKKKPDKDEIIKAVKLPFKKAYKLFLSGKKPTTSYTLLGMALAKEKLNL